MADGDAEGMRREVLRGVLRALVCGECGSVPHEAPKGARWPTETCPQCKGSGWRHETPQEAYECLQTHGLIPPDDDRRGFVSTGTVTNGATCDVPDHIPELLAWASLGTATILHAEELAWETVRRLKEWDAPQSGRIVWSVGKWRLDVDTRGRGPSGDPWPTPTGWPTGRIYPDSKGSWLTSPNEWWEKQVSSWDRESPCPYAPMVMLKETGAWMEAITADAITLVVPPIG